MKNHTLKTILIHFFFIVSMQPLYTMEKPGTEPDIEQEIEEKIPGWIATLNDEYYNKEFQNYIALFDSIIKKIETQHPIIQKNIYLYMLAEAVKSKNDIIISTITSQIKQINEVLRAGNTTDLPRALIDKGKEKEREKEHEVSFATIIADCMLFLKNLEETLSEPFFVSEFLNDVLAELNPNENIYFLVALIKNTATTLPRVTEALYKHLQEYHRTCFQGTDLAHEHDYLFNDLIDYIKAQAPTIQFEEKKDILAEFNKVAQPLQTKFGSPDNNYKVVESPESSSPGSSSPRSPTVYHPRILNHNPFNTPFDIDSQGKAYSTFLMLPIIQTLLATSHDGNIDLHFLKLHETETRQGISDAAPLLLAKGTIKPANPDLHFHIFDNVLVEGKITIISPHEAAPISMCQLMCHGNYLVTTYHDGRIIIDSLLKQKTEHELLQEYEQRVTALYSLSTHKILLGTENGAVDLWNLKKLKRVKSLVPNRILKNQTVSAFAQFGRIPFLLRGKKHIEECIIKPGKETFKSKVRFVQKNAKINDMVSLQDSFQDLLVLALNNGKLKAFDYRNNEKLKSSIEHFNPRENYGPIQSIKAFEDNNLLIIYENNALRLFQPSKTLEIINEDYFKPL